MTITLSILPLLKGDFGPFLFILVIFVIIVTSVFDKTEVTHSYTSQKHFDPIEPTDFSQFAKYTNSNLIGAYLCLSREMITKDMINSKEKVNYIRTYFQKKYPLNVHAFREAYVYYFNNPKTISSVCYWLNKRIKIKEEKIEILNFLCGITMIDGKFSNQEYNYLKQIQHLLHLEQIDLNTIIEKYTKRSEQKKTTTNYTYQKKETLIETYTKILGVSPNSNFDEIKKAYRKLVMIHHPDKFEGDSDQQKEKAKERFLKIQEAYDYFEKKLNIR